MKKLLMTTTAASAVMAMASPAQADAYVSVFGGTNYLDDQPDIATALATAVNYPWAAYTGYTFTYTRNFFGFGDVAEVDDGYVIGAAIGMSLDDYAPGLSVELEMAKRNNDASLTSFSSYIYQEACCDYSYYAGGPYQNTNPGEINALSLMANVWYEFDLDFAVHPYVGAGVGVAMVEYETHSLLGELEKNSFAYQLMAGIGIDLSECLRLGIEYRYFDAPDAEFTAPGQTAVPFDYNVQNVIIGLKYSF